MFQLLLIKQWWNPLKSVPRLQQHEHHEHHEQQPAGQEVLREELQRYFQGYDPRIMALCVVGKVGTGFPCHPCPKCPGICFSRWSRVNACWYTCGCEVRWSCAPTDTDTDPLKCRCLKLWTPQNPSQSMSIPWFCATQMATTKMGYQYVYIYIYTYIYIYMYIYICVCIYIYIYQWYQDPPASPPGAPERPAIRGGGVPWCRAPANEIGPPQLGKSLPAAETATLGGRARVGSPLLASHLVVFFLFNLL